jgi:hypothetical protein
VKRYLSDGLGKLKIAIGEADEAADEQMGQRHAR